MTMKKKKTPAERKKENWKQLAIRREVLPLLEESAKIIKEECDRLKTPTISEAIYYMAKEFLAKRKEQQSNDPNNSNTP